jgi:hypothetical protein
MPSKNSIKNYREKHPHQVRMTSEEYATWRNFKSEIRDRESLLKDEADAAGIDLKDIKHYWYKSEKFSMFAKNESKTYEELRDEIIVEMDKYSPKYPKIKRKPSKDGHLLVISPADVHLGKLASSFETSDPYNHHIAYNRCIDGVKGILDKSSGFNIDKINLIIGNDILHVDNPRNTTTKGTNQDTSLMWYDSFRLARELYVEVIEMLLTVADVHLTYNPSNHDYMSGFMLADSIKSWFRLSKNVTFDFSIAHRKYFKYGKNLIGSTHGDGAKHDKLPQLMSIEAKKEWSECEHYYIYTHHLHHKTSKDYMNVNVETLRSPSGTDSYHHINGYEHAPKAIEGFIHCKNHGQVSRLTHIF